MRLVLKSGSDVYGLPSQETYLDSQKFHSDAAKISIFLLYSKYLHSFFAGFSLQRALFHFIFVLLQMHYAANVVVTDWWHHMPKHNNGFGNI